MDSKIIAINQRFLTDTRLPVGADIKKDVEMLAYFGQFCYKDQASDFALIPRAGINNLPFENSFVEILGLGMPAPDPTFNLTWEDVTDARTKDIQHLINNNKKIYVQWSGGIDSTCIVVALLKNLNRQSLDQITICLTYDSVMEYPSFYKDHLLPNFKIQDINEHPLELHKLQDGILIDGHGADTLSMSMSPSLDVNMAVRQGDLLNQSWRTKPDALIDYLAKVTNSRDFAIWYYDRISESVQSVDLEIETYFDFMWWAGFNYDWISQLFSQWFHKLRYCNKDFQQFRKKYFPWYSNADYQLWSLKNIGVGAKHNNTLRSFKKDAKKYCYDYTNDVWNYRYQIKISSRGRPGYIKTGQPFAVTDDFRVLDLEKDLDLILDLWPTHLKS
jgi:hypothetical protein